MSRHMKLDGSNPSDKSDEEDPFVASVETKDDDDTESFPSVSYEEQRTDDIPHHRETQSIQTEPIIELPADGPSGTDYLIIREMEKFRKKLRTTPFRRCSGTTINLNLKCGRYKPDSLKF
ncbi:unnamed protein product [Aphanomyces euteiches]